jgi:plasmid stability protein
MMVAKRLHYGTCGMASLTLKNLPDELLEDLRKAAEKDRRSLNQEVMHLLTLALRARASKSAPSVPAVDVRAQLSAWRKLAGKWASEVDRETEAAALYKGRTRGRKLDL